MDPDHGMFAHQLAGFDLYSGSKEYPMQVSEEFPSSSKDVGWVMTCRVPAADKLKARDREKRSGNQRVETKPLNSTALRTSITTFVAPAVVTMCRRDDQNRTSFLSAFWVTPTGTGRSRFLTATAARAPFSVPRWFQHVFLNAFLDQDTVLVASQQPHTLSAELDQYIQDEADRKKEARAGRVVGARLSTYLYQSPSDRMVRLIDAFWDATLSRSPSRLERLKEMKAKGELRGYPRREVALDLESQHLRICKDSRDAVRNCRRIVAASSVLTIAWLALRATGRILCLPRPFRSVAWPVMTALVGWAADFIRRGFYYGYTEDKLRRDLAKIPTKTWTDPA
jgi:hypothetical protein